MTGPLIGDLPASIEVAVDSLRFPEECVRCGQAAADQWRLEAKRGIDLIIVSYYQYLSIQVPVCKACRRRRRIAGVIAWTFPFLVLPLGALLAEIGLIPDTNELVMGGLGLTMVSFFMVRWFGGRILDGPFLGVRAGRLPPDRKRVTLYFARGMYARRVEDLSRATATAMIGEAR